MPRRKIRTNHGIRMEAAATPVRGHILCGINAVREALGAGECRVEKVWLTERKVGRRLQEIEALAAERGVRLEVTSEHRLSEVTGTTSHQGVVAFGEAAYLVGLQQLVARLPGHGRLPLLVVLDGVKDPRNLGAIIRSAAAFGIGGVVLPRRRAVGLTATVAKTAAGGLEHVDVAEVVNVSQGIEYLKRSGFWVVGADERADCSCRTFAFPTPLALVLGEEGMGISALVRRHCDALVAIPTLGSLRSLNVAVAASVLLYEVVGRQQAG